MLARAKAELIKEEFKEWLFSELARRKKYVRIYNDRFNNIRLREYDGSYLTFPGMNPDVQLRTHQKNAVARIIRGGNTLLAHRVGAGKSFEMAAAAMELKRLGLANKPMDCCSKSFDRSNGGRIYSFIPGSKYFINY